MASVPGWVWTAMGSALVFAGACLMLTGRVRWSRPGVRLCGRCGYDMKGLTTLTCPECGRTARSERSLHRVRARTWVRLVGLVAVVVGLAGLRTGAVIEHGWPAGFPGWALACFGPSSGSPSTGPAMLIDVAYPVAAPSGGYDVRDRLFLESVRRLGGGEFSAWEERRFVSRCMQDRRNIGSVYHYMRARWPWDRPIPAYREEYTPWSFIYASMPGPSRSVRVTGNMQIPRGRLVSVTFDADIDATASARNFLDSVSSPELDAAILRALRPRLVIEKGAASVEIDDRRDSASWTLITCLLEFRVRLFVSGREVAHGVCDMRTKNEVGITLTPGMWWEPSGQEAVLAHPDEVEVELEGDLTAAAERELKRGTGMRSAWSGVVRMRLPVERR